MAATQDKDHKANIKTVQKWAKEVSRIYLFFDTKNGKAVQLCWNTC